MSTRWFPVLLLVSSCDAGPADEARPCGEPNQHAQLWSGERQVFLVGAATWTTATALEGTDFVNVPQIDVELLVQTDACTHKLTFNVRRPNEGHIPYGLIATNGAAAFSGAYAGDLPSQPFTDASTLILTQLSDTLVSGRFTVVGDKGLNFTLGAFNNVPISGPRPD